MVIILWFYNCACLNIILWAFNDLSTQYIFLKMFKYNVGMLYNICESIIDTTHKYCINCNDLI